MIYFGVANCYWLTMYNVTNLGGNKFTNGVILGVAEMFSGVFTCVLMHYFHPFQAFRICAFVAVVFNALNQFVVPFGTIASYLTLSIAVFGVGGVYTCVYIMVGIVLPSEQISGAMIIVVTAGGALSLGAPLMVLLDSPYPYICLTFFMSVGVVGTFMLKDASLQQEIEIEAEIGLLGWDKKD